MAKITLKIDSKKLRQIEAKLNKLEALLTATDAPIYTYILSISNGYAEAVISGMGKTHTGVLTLKSFLGERATVDWKPLAPITLKRKLEAGWKLEIWMASGETAKAVRVFMKSGKTSIEASAGIPSGSAEYDKAIRTEFGGYSNPDGRPYDRRALFTLLNIIFAGKTEKIKRDILKAVRESIKQINWGS